MKNIILSLFTFYCFSFNLCAQGTSDLSSVLLKSQKEYIINNIAQKQQARYLSLIHFSNVIHPKVIDEIKKIAPSFTTNSQNVNVLEGFTGYNEITGVVWLQDSTYFTYNYGAGKKLTVNQSSFSQLNDAEVIILAHFNDWSQATFTTNGQALAGPTDHPFFLASKVDNGVAPSVQSIGFYYPAQ